MFDSVKKNQPNQQSRGKPSLIFLILILGIFSAVGVGIMVVDLVRGLYPRVLAAPGIYKTLNYQGKLQDLDGITVADGSYNIKFTIYDAVAAGNVLWTARESDACGAPFNPSAKSVTTSVGVFSTMLGETGDCPLNLNFNDDSYYFGITVGADAEMTPRKRIGASGYAFNADLLDGLNTSAAGGASAFVPATDSSGNFVLTGNVTFDTPTFFLDSTNNNIGIGTAAPDIARTLDLTTTKKYGVYSVSSYAGNDVAAVYGEATSALNHREYGGYFTAAGITGHGVHGEATSASGAMTPNYGGYFTTAGVAGNGVYGEASASGAVTNYGGSFSAAGNTGYGVYSLATGTAGANYGGYFRANGAGGYGVYGYAADTTAVANIGGSFSAAGTADNTMGVSGAANAAGAVRNYGGFFTAAGTKVGTSGVYGQASGSGFVYGVYGNATATGAVQNSGGFFETAGDSGVGVFGRANATGAVLNVGVSGESAGNLGRGVYGNATATGAVTNYGGYFSSAGDTGIAVYGSASSAAAAVNYGGQFYGYGQNGRGVYGQAAATGAFINYGGVFDALGDSGVGVYGTASATGAIVNYGGYFTSAGDTGYGVYGAATDATGPNYGGFFQASGANSYGVFGAAPDSTALAVNFGGYFSTNGVGTDSSGVYGQASGAGTVYGVHGVASSVGGAVANYGGFFEAGGQGGGRGVYGRAVGVGGTNYGVYGDVTSAAGWGGYFTGGNGLYASRFSIADTTSGIAYNTIGAPAASHTAAGEIENASDLFIADDLEIDGFTWLDGGSADIAEMIAYSGEGEAGDVIVIDDKNDNSAKLSTKPYDQTAIGIIATEPSLIITGKIEEGKLLAIAGRVPTKVTNANGAIHRGDLLTTSSIPGRAMKATESGPIVGKAMGECDKSECTIWVFLNVSWYGGVRTETAAAASPVIEDTKNLERDNLLAKLAEFWQKIISLIKK